MKDRSVWVFVVFALLVLGGIYLLRRKPPAQPATTAPVATQPATSPEKKTAPAPAAATPTQAAPVVRAGPGGAPVPIQDGRTIDMSSGRPVVRDDARSRAALEKGVKEMEDAAKSVTFGPRPAAPAEKKKPNPDTPAPKS